MKTLKLATCKYLDELPSKGNNSGRAFRDKDMEREVLNMTRNYGIGAQIINLLGFEKIRLLTNNPQKVKSMAALNIIVTERLNLVTEPTKENADYLLTKAAKSGHLIK